MKESNEEELILNDLKENIFIDEGENEVSSKYSSSIPESASNKIFDSIVRIEFNGFIGTGFLIQIKTKLKLIRFLLTCNHVIEQKHVDSKTKIKIFYGNKFNESSTEIILDNNQRFIKCFEQPIDITVIQILISDYIGCDKYLIPDYNYKEGYDNYVNKRFYLAGYPIFESKYKGERHICSGTINAVKNSFEFKHTLDTHSGSSGSPLCLIDEQTVIGIHKRGNKKSGYNYGTFIGVILDYLSEQKIEENMEDNSITIPKLLEGFQEVGKSLINNKIREIQKSIPPYKLFKFSTLEEYNKNLVDFHNRISECYKSLNEENFVINIEKVIQFLNKEKILIHYAHKDEFIDKERLLALLMEINNRENIDQDLLNIIIDILYSENIQYLEMISYFIAILMMKLNSYTFLDEKNCILEFEEFINISDLKKLENSKNEIILINNFIIVEKKVDSFFSGLFNAVDSFKKILRKMLEYEYKVKILINYNYKENNIPNCFKNSEDNNYIFPPFSFYKVMNVEINSYNNSGIITLNNVGRKEILENNDNIKNGLTYNIDENIIEIKKNENNK